MTAIRVEVTAEQIADAGDDRHLWAQPVEAALAALTGQEVDIDAGGSNLHEHWCVATIGQDEWTIVVDLPDAANAWLEARWGDEADSGFAERTTVAERGEPFTFEIEIPTWVLDLVHMAEAA